MHIRMLVAAACAVMMAACTSAPAPAPQTNAADLGAINKVRSDFQSAFNRGDAAGIAALYADNAVVMPTHHAIVTGVPAIRDYNAGFFDAMTAQINITPAETKIIDDWAFDRGSFTMTLTPKAGGAAMTDQGKYLVLLQKQPDGSWKLTHDIDNSDMPMPAPPAPEAAGKGK